MRRLTGNIARIPNLRGLANLPVSTIPACSDSISKPRNAVLCSVTLGLACSFALPWGAIKRPPNLDTAVAPVDLRSKTTAAATCSSSEIQHLALIGPARNSRRSDRLTARCKSAASDILASQIRQRRFSQPELEDHHHPHHRPEVASVPRAEFVAQLTDKLLPDDAASRQ